MQHLTNPSAALARIATWLNKNGLLRIITYPKQSRCIMKLTSQYFTEHGLNEHTPHLLKECFKVLKKLPASHAFVSCFKSHSEINQLAGLVDAFFHPLENPLSPLEWKQASLEAGLHWICDDQKSDSSSQALLELFPQTQELAPWLRLQIWDDLLEICDNPVYWFYKNETPVIKNDFQFSKNIFPNRQSNFDDQLHHEITLGMERAKVILAKNNLPLEVVITKLNETYGPRVDTHNNILPGLSILDYVS